MSNELKEKVTDGILGKIQPWQAIFGMLSYVIFNYDMEIWQNLTLIAILAVMLGHAMVNKNKHTEAMKEVVTPFIVDQLFKTLEEYLPPKEEQEPIVVEKIVEKIVEVPVEKIVYLPTGITDNTTTATDTMTIE